MNAIYCRKSISIENSESIETQIHLCRAYAKGEVEIYIDDGWTGGNTERPNFKRLMVDIKKGKIDTLIIYKIDRISRNIIDFMKIYETLKKYNVKLISVTEHFDTSTPLGELLLFILSAFANLERENIRERVKDNMLNLAKKGFYTGGKLAFGCTTEKNDGKSIIKIQEVEQISALFEYYLRTGSLYKTKKFADKEGIKVANASSIARILKNPIYAESTEKINEYFKLKGYEIVGEPNGNGYMTYSKDSNPFLIVGRHKPCIDSETFLRANKMLDKNNNSGRVSKVYWLTEVLYCSKCGHKYVLANSKGNYYYVCERRLRRAKNGIGIDKNLPKCENNKYVNAEMIEKEIEQLINFLSYDGVEVKRNNDYEFEIKQLTKQIGENKSKIENLVDKLSLMSNNSAKTLLSRIEELNQENMELEYNLRELQEKNLNQTVNIKPFIDGFKHLKTNEEKRISVRIIFKKIIYNAETEETELIFN